VLPTKKKAAEARKPIIKNLENRREDTYGLSNPAVDKAVPE
jgi:hypothetical protein